MSYVKTLIEIRNFTWETAAQLYGADRLEGLRNFVWEKGADFHEVILPYLKLLPKFKKEYYPYYDNGKRVFSAGRYIYTNWTEEYDASYLLHCAKECTEAGLYIPFPKRIKTWFHVEDIGYSLRANYALLAEKRFLEVAKTCFMLARSVIKLVAHLKGDKNLKGALNVLEGGKFFGKVVTEVSGKGRVGRILAYSVMTIIKVRSSLPFVRRTASSTLKLISAKDSA